MFQAALVAVIVVLFVVLGTFALVLHAIPLLIDESLSPNGFDYAPAARAYSFILVVLVSSHAIRQMSSACVL